MKGEGADDGGVPNGRLLVSFAEAVLGDEEAPLARTRRVLSEIMGPAALVDAAAVVAGFNSVDRIADATGIPLDADLEMMSKNVRAELGIERAGTPTGT